MPIGAETFLMMMMVVVVVVEAMIMAQIREIESNAAKNRRKTGE